MASRRTLELLSRRVVGGGGSILEFGVVCPRRGHYASLTACMACTACDGIRVGKSASDNALLCVLDDDADAPGRRNLLELRASQVAVSEIMNPHVLCVRSDLTAAALVGMLLERHMNEAPVVDALGRPVGIVSQTDALRWLGGDRAGQPTACVADLMTPVAYSLPANETVARAAALLAVEHLGGVPVLAPSGQVIGMVTAGDVMRWVARSGGYAVDARE